LSRQAHAQYKVIRADGSREIEEGINALLNAGSKVLDIQLAPLAGGIAVAVLHVPGYFKATDVFGGEVKEGDAPSGSPAPEDMGSDDLEEALGE
jgi:hypothetical protein